MILELFDRGRGSDLAIAIAGDGPAVTYDSMRQQIAAAVSQLNGIGLGRGDRIAIALPNGLETIVSFLAAATAGTAAPLNPAYRREEFRFYLEDTGARAIIVPPAGAEEARSAATNIPIIEASLNSEGKVILSSASSVGPKCERRDPEPSDIALILHTSGTTSRPKRVALANANLMASVLNVADTYELTRDDVSFCVMPLFHVHGLVASTLATLATGGTVLVAPRFNALSFWRAARENHVTWYSAVPSIHQMLLARTKSGTQPAQAEKLRFIRSCSAALPPAMMADLEEKFGVPVLEAYGMTEAAHQMASNPLPPAIRKPGSVGRGTRVAITILDEKGEALPAGVPGEVSIKGANVFSGYEGNPDANAEAFVDGWFRTGDQGYLDAEGYLYLTGRIKELINRGGEKISPREIDEALLTHPAVAEAVCFGAPDRIYGEEVAAAVVLKGPATEAELIAHCKRLVADFKCPKTIQIVSAIPRGATGKIQRRIIAAEISKIT